MDWEWLVFTKFPITKGNIENQTWYSGSFDKTNTLSLYPNPARNNLILHYNLEKSAQVFVSIYNNKGQKVLDYNAGNQQTGLNKISMNISSLTNGMFMIKVQANEITFNSTFIKQ